ncbi:metallophosphoesterase family protein [Jatrophihabitans sp. DSM 45814]
MKIGIVSDVHCQHEILAETVAAMDREGVDEILLAGDAHYEYRFSNEVVELTREHKMRYVLGNHEMMLMGPRGERAATAPHVRQANADFVRETPDRIRTQVGGKILTMVHASPWQPFDQYLYRGNPQFERCDELDTDYLILGHTHVPMSERFGRTLVINPGSLAFSRDEGAFDLITYAILDTTTDEVRLIREPKTKPLPT